MRPAVNRSLVLPLLFLGVASHTTIALAQSAGTFTTTGSMNAPRFGHSATLLLNGKVLIAGGGNARAELYDPSTGTFTLTGTMTTDRGGAAILLADGRVLILAGSASAELYDPVTGTFAATGASILPYVTWATLLSNGEVLITGSRLDPTSRDVQPFNLAELYDPSTGTFTATGNMTWGHVANNATLLPGGKVLIAEGRSDWNNGVGPVVHAGGAELYDPAIGTFSPTGDMTSDVIWAPSTLLKNGKVLFAGGDDSNTGTGYSSAQVYDPSTGTFVGTGSMTTGRFDHTSTLLPDGTVFIAGSQRSGFDGGSSLASTELYDPATGTFTAAGNMITARFAHTATLLPDGTVLIAGGICQGCNGNNVRASAEIYHPAVLAPAPMLLSLSGDGQGQGAIQHAGTYRIASAGDPAVAGEYLSIYLTGLADGSLIPPQVAIGGRLAEITFFGNVPGYPGLNVVNVRMPDGVAPGPAVPVRLTYLSRPSNAVTIGVR